MNTNKGVVAVVAISEEEFPKIMAITPMAVKGRTYAEYTRITNAKNKELIAKLQPLGIAVQEVNITAEELIEFCRLHKRQPDGACRAQLAATKLAATSLH
jgi:hypothetical protein